MPGHKVDANQHKIVQFIRVLGHECVDRTQQRPSAGYDLDMLAIGKIIPCEVKNPDEPWVFTPKEIETAALYGKHGITIHLLEYPEDVLKVLEIESED